MTSRMETDEGEKGKSIWDEHFTFASIGLILLAGYLCGLLID